MILKKQHGETIVEVLISVTVLGLILSASYALANKSTQANRQAQERSEALNENSARLEQFKTFLEDGGSIPGGNFCVYQDNTGELKATSAGFTGGVPPIANDDNLANYPNQCKSGTDNRYNTSIKKSGDTYIFKTRWFKVAGTGVEEISLLYKTYKASELSYDPDIGSQPTDIEIVSCDNDEYLDSTGNVCVQCPPNFSSPGGTVTECTLASTIIGENFSDCWYLPVQGYCVINDFADFPDSVAFFCGWQGTLWGACGGTNNATAFFSYKFSGIPAGSYEVVLKYYNRPNPSYPPPGYGHFHVKVSSTSKKRIIFSNLKSDENTVDQTTLNLPIESNSNASKEHTYQVSGFNVPANPYIELNWDNDAWENGDANFGLISITLRKTAP